MWCVRCQEWWSVCGQGMIVSCLAAVRLSVRPDGDGTRYVIPGRKSPGFVSMTFSSKYCANKRQKSHPGRITNIAPFTTIMATIRDPLKKGPENMPPSTPPLQEKTVSPSKTQNPAYPYHRATVITDNHRTMDITKK